MKRVVIVILLSAAAVICAQETKDPSPKPSIAERLTEQEVSKLRIADLELVTVQQELALLQARFRELQEQLPKLQESARAAYADVLKAHGAEGGRIDMKGRVVIPPEPKPAAK
jgi:hypothetical protein